MKKNITINLCGRLFQIDEDAYEMLQHYMDSLRSHFGKQQGGEEIADDIEERIAELFDELKQQGTQALTIDHVKDIITRIGRPEDMDDADETASTEHQSDESRETTSRARSTQSPKRLYRNPNDKMVAGVLSGLAAYTGIDVTFWRLATVVFTLFYGTGLIAYIVLAIVLPQANTPEEQLKMQGKEVNPQNLADVVAGGQQGQPVQSSGLREVFSILLKVVFGCFIALAIFVGGTMGIGFIGVLIAVIFALFAPATSAVTMPFTLGGMGLVEVWQEHPAVLIVFVIALLALLFIPVYAIAHMVLSLTKKIQPMSTTQRIVWIVLWLLALCCVIPAGGMIGMLHDEYSHVRVVIQNNQQTDSITVAGQAVIDETDSIAAEAIVAYSDTTDQHQ